MSNALRRSMTTEEFLDWEERQEMRFEFDGRAPLALVGGSVAHATIAANLTGALGAHLRGGPCRSHGGGLRLRTPTGQIRYPDAMVICSPSSPGAIAVDEPVVLFEIVSADSSDRDFFDKNIEYRTLPSLRRYVLLPQDLEAAAVFVRQGDVWLSESLVGLDAVLRMPEIGIELPLSELYAGVELEPETDRDEAGR